MDQNAILKELEDFGFQLKKDLTVSLIRKGHTTKTSTGAGQSGIIGSMQYDVYSKGDNVLLEFFMDDHWYWLEYGRHKTRVGKGQKPYSQTLAGRLFDWIPQKGLNARNIVKENYAKRLKSIQPSESKFLKKNLPYQKYQKSLSHAIAANIHKKGWSKYPNGSHFLSEVMLDGRFTKLAENISVLLGKEIVFEVDKAFK